MRVYGSTAWGSVSKAGVTIGSPIGLPVASISGQPQQARAIFIRNSNLCVNNTNTLQNLFTFNSDITVLKGDISNLYGSPLTGMPTVSSLMQTTVGYCPHLRSIGQLVFGSLNGDILFYRSFEETFTNCTSLRGDSAKVWNDTKKAFEPLYKAITASRGMSISPYKNDTGLSDYNSIPIVWGGGGQ
jgi:hypothetical protein